MCFCFAPGEERERVSGLGRCWVRADDAYAGEMMMVKNDKKHNMNSGILKKISNKTSPSFWHEDFLFTFCLYAFRWHNFNEWNVSLIFSQLTRTTLIQLEYEYVCVFCLACILTLLFQYLWIYLSLIPSFSFCTIFRLYLSSLVFRLIYLPSASHFIKRTLFSFLFFVPFRGLLSVADNQYVRFTFYCFIGNWELRVRTLFLTFFFTPSSDFFHQFLRKYQSFLRYVGELNEKSVPQLTNS